MKKLILKDALLNLNVDTKQIRIKKKTIERLIEHGRMTDTFDMVINRIMDENEELKKSKK
jgi:hypothetical protein